jgi:E3 ubiquitin-protein ligase BRE1
MTLDQALSTLHEDHTDDAQRIAPEVSVQEELARTSKELARYRSIFGESPSPETHALVQQLQAKEDELKKLRLLTEQQAQAETSLYAEIDRLSSLWESLDQQVKKKVFDLAGFEEKLQRAAHDVRLSDLYGLGSGWLTCNARQKAKAENKYFAAMREKEMAESERKAMARQLEKQGKAVERASEVEKHLSAQVVCHFPSFPRRLVHMTSAIVG